MKKLTLFLILYALPVFSIVSPVSTHPSTAPPTSTTPPVQPKPAPPSRPKLIIPPSDRTVKAPLSMSGELFYHPGVVSGESGRWVGGDNFLNMSKSIALQVNFVKTEKLDLPITQDKIQADVAQIFERGGLMIGGGSSGAKPPLPFFNLIVMVFQTTDGFAASCQGRLFEEVTLSRVQFKGQEAFQAITWEQTNLVFGPADQFEKQLKDTVEGIAKSFVTRLTAQSSPTK